MGLLEHRVRLLLITISDDSDIKGIRNELNKHGKVIGKVFTDKAKIKCGAFLWKHDKTLAPDDFYLVMISGRPSIKEAATELKIEAISKRGLINLQKFHEDYPNVIIHDIGALIQASEVEKAAGAIAMFSGTKRIKHKAQKTIEDLREEMKKMTKGVKGFTTRELNIGALIIKNDADFKKLVDELPRHTAKKELWAGRFPEMDVGLIIWHHEIPGKKNEYWVILVLDEDSILEGKLFDVHAPDIGKFKKEYGNVIPIHEIPLKSPILIGVLDAGTITKEFETKLKEIKGKI